MAGEQFAQLGEGVYSVHPQRRDGYEALLRELRGLHKTPTTVVHCWSITPGNQGRAGAEALARAQDTGFYSVLFLAQALGEQCRTEPLHVIVVSNNLHDVTGAEVLCPEKATLLGCCKVLPQEYPHMTCRSVDVVPAAAGSRQAERLAAQLTAEVSACADDAVVAYRGPHRWVQTFVPVRLESAPARPALLRDRGVYLITGGLGGIGLLLAEYLARAVRAKLVLTGRTGLPPRHEWKQLLAGAESRDGRDRTAQPAVQIALEEEAGYITRTAKQRAEEFKIKGIQDYAGLEESLNKLCAIYVCEYFKDNGVNIKSGMTYSKKEIKDILQILQKFEKFYEFMLNVLRDEGVIRLLDNKIEFLKGMNETSFELENELGREYTEFSGLFSLLEHCVNNYGPALRGEKEAISVLYPYGSADLLREATKNTVEHDNRRVWFDVVKDVVSLIAKNSADRKLRILEIGGGSGRMTRAVIPGLERENVEYYFTDIGKSFVTRAEQEAAQHGVHFMRFGVLDIARDPAEQGYQDQSFDLIIGLDVVHATRSIEKTVSHLKNLLAPHGMLCLVEAVRTRRWVDMIWGLAEGWWYFDDVHLRQDSPLLHLDAWEGVLRAQGFQSVKAFPQDAAERRETDYGLIMAQQHAPAVAAHAPDWVTVRRRAAAPLIPDRIRKVRELERLGAEVLVLSADVANPQHMQAVVRQAYEHFGDIHGVIHAAAIAGGGLMHLQTPETVRREFAPKVEGALVLDALFQHRRLDFLALCSSFGSITGGAGQVGYCAANAFLDAFAHYNTAQSGTYTVAINWDRWRDVGLAVAVEARHRALTGEEAGTEGMAPGEGVEAFRRILSHPGLPQVVVSTQDFPSYVERARAARAAQTLDALAQVRLAKSVHPRPPLGQAYVAPRNEVEQRLADIWQEVFGIEPVGIHDGFLDLGGESLIALQLLNRLRAAFQVELSLRRFFEAPTIAGISEAITQVRDDSASGRAPAIVPLSREAHRSRRSV
jgi:NAD(P)-dependent dehydrogenase (short-subunit alcohol dehydrogenase family)/acyl carrier protein